MTGLEIRANEGEQIQIGQSTVVVERARNGKLTVNVKAPPNVVVRWPMKAASAVANVKTV